MLINYRLKNLVPIFLKQKYWLTCFLILVISKPIFSEIEITADKVISGSITGKLSIIDTPSDPDINGSTTAPTGSDWPTDADDGWEFVVLDGGRNNNRYNNNWEPDGSVYATNNSEETNFWADGTFRWTFDLPDGTVIHKVYASWNGQGNQPGGEYTYDEETTGSVSKVHTSHSTNNIVLRWTDSLSNTHDVNFETLFSTDIVVSGGNGFAITLEASDAFSAYIAVSDAILVDYTLPPSVALSGNTLVSNSPIGTFVGNVTYDLSSSNTLYTLGNSGDNLLFDMYTTDNNIVGALRSKDLLTSGNIYNITVTGNNLSGNVDSNDFTIGATNVISPLMLVNADVTASANAVIATMESLSGGETVTYSITAGREDLMDISGNNLIVQPDSVSSWGAGPYYVTLTANTSGNTSSVAVKVEVTPAASGTLIRFL